VDERLAVGSSGVDGILIDLGMSSMQVNRSNRGFSVLQDGPLDMRMDPKVSVTLLLPFQVFSSFYLLMKIYHV